MGYVVERGVAFLPSYTCGEVGSSGLALLAAYFEVRALLIQESGHDDCQGDVAQQHPIYVWSNQGEI